MIKSFWLFVSRNPRGASKVGFFAQSLDLATDELGWDVGPNQGASARNAKPCSMVKLRKLEATIAQQQKEIEALTAGL